MFSLVRRIALITFVVIIVCVRKKLKLSSRKRIVYSCLLALFLILVFDFPVENIVHTFTSPEDAYKYVYTDIDSNTIMGKNSAMVIPVETVSDFPQEYFVKSEDGWKLKYWNSTRIVKNYIYENAGVTIISCAGDYYITVVYPYPAIILDNKNSILYNRFNPLEDGEKTSFAVAYVEDITDYALIIDGKTIQIT